MTSMAKESVVIIGAGAAGLMCALTAGQRGRRVLVLDHAGRVGEKILISGGGSSNFTNLYLGSEHYISGNPHFCKSALSRYSEKEINEIAAIFHKWHIMFSGTEGYKVAEVTRGGVDTEDLSSKTFEARNVKGLYFIGEVVDVTGWLGGYNLQWAWSSGFCAGQFV